MRIAIGSDHRGVQVRSRLAQLLTQRGHEVEDVGTNDEGSVDYPDIAARVAQRVSAGEADRGILVCGTGIGMAIAANKFAGVRAATVHDEFEAEMSRRHNDLNVLCLAAELVGEAGLDALIDVWLRTEFEAGRHARRIEKIKELEERRG